MTGPNFIDERHTIFVGWVLGTAWLHQLPLRPVTDEAGNYTDRLTLDLRPGVTITIVVPPPADDWEMPE